uniref:CA174 protein n=1 Tax=Cyclopterus lumpus TaxID=8103 RepID=A0A8C3A7J6_CYCLU
YAALQMPGQLDSLKPRKRKSSATKVSESSSVASSCGKADAPPERFSIISCECHQLAGRRRCSASPQLDGREGKENELRARLDELDSCGVSGVHDKRESEDMDCGETNKDIFPDDDSNQILPVEQFFGNLDAIQDFPHRSSETSARVQREHRRRHYYAPEDSDEEELQHWD